MNGPVPALNGLSVKSAPIASTTFCETIMPARSTRAARSGANAFFKLNFTVLASTTSTLATAARSPVRDDPFVLMYRSMFHFTDAASKTEPSWNLTPWRRLNVTVLPSLDVVHFSASHGMMVPFTSTRTSESYIA